MYSQSTGIMVGSIHLILKEKFYYILNIIQWGSYFKRGYDRNPYRAARDGWKYYILCKHGEVNK
jgi:hypothetical protein